MVWVWSEHAIGFLKGRFQSLKHLRIWIDGKDTHQFAAYWVLAYIAVHSFAMECEEGERGDDDPADDLFVAEGLDDSDGSDAADEFDGDENTGGGNGGQQKTRESPRLRAARELREKLKRALLLAKKRL